MRSVSVMIVLGLVSVGCGSRQAPVRRPLVTDSTPLGADTAYVTAWYDEPKNGWCLVDRSASRLRYRTCDTSKTPVFSELTFVDDHLVQADVTVEVGPVRERQNIGAPSGSSEFEWSYDRTQTERPSEIAEQDPALELIDVLAGELEVRYGKPEVSEMGARRKWVHDREEIVLFHDDRIVIERHALRQVASR